MILLLAKKDGNAIAGLILFKFKNRLSAEFAVSDESFRDLSPNHFLFWDAIKLAYNEGCEIFDFGRTSPKNKSLMDFKKRWGTKVVELPQFFYPQKEAEKAGCVEESWKYEAMSKLCEKAPDCIQEFIGNFCYRHLG
jgi:lipid II:glycine glycyltransferase (peptidoglycan interpeptide bridge formation enzyme)